MRFPPQFLDEIRARLPVSGVCARRVKLIRRGREFVGLSPFTKERTPSFTVNDEKGFFHCFSSGRHGDIFSFVMETEGLGFAEAVERLAEQAGVEVPRLSAEDRAVAARRQSLYEVVEAACNWFQAQLAHAGGAAAAGYLERRGVDSETRARFRLGYAPPGDGLLKALMRQGIGNDALVEAGLARRPDDGRPPFPFFRDRVIFPIGDRRGRIVAFGGRIMGEGEPKYLNSPDTPLFDKSRTLYNLAGARQAAHDGAEVVVVEGYMDVIALARAGFGGAVAPLGTALTEEQLQQLWRLAAEPILCFDGDGAGARAAARAMERVLPLLKPGRSLRFAALPQGHDPDSLVAEEGAGGFRRVLMGARTLVDVLWSVEFGRGSLDTPERRAAFEARLMDRVASIGDEAVRAHYRDAVRERIYGAFRARGRRRRGPAGGFAPASADVARPTGSPPARLQAMVGELSAGRRRQQAILAVLVNHPPLREEYLEAMSGLQFAPDLDKLRQELQNLFAGGVDLDPAAVRDHFTQHDDASVFKGVLSRAVFDHAPFARSEAPTEVARRALAHMMGREMVERQRAELRELGRAPDLSDESRATDRLLALSAAAVEWDRTMQEIDGDPTAQAEGE